MHRRRITTDSTPQFFTQRIHQASPVRTQLVSLCAATMSCTCPQRCASGGLPLGSNLVSGWSTEAESYASQSAVLCSHPILHIESSAKHNHGAKQRQGQCNSRGGPVQGPTATQSRKGEPRLPDALARAKPSKPHIPVATSASHVYRPSPYPHWNVADNHVEEPQL